MTNLPICQQLRDPASVMQVADHAADVIEAMHTALIQARGALLLDAMVDDNGEPYGTTSVALDAINVARARAEGRSP